MHKVTIINAGDDIVPTNIYIDGVELCGWERFRYFSAGVGEAPVFRFDIVGFPDVVEINNAGLEFQFTPATIREAMRVFRHELKTDEGFYGAFVASICSSLEEVLVVDPEHISIGDMAKKVLDRIIGEELDV